MVAEEKLLSSTTHVLDSHPLSDSYCCERPEKEKEKEGW